MKGALGGMLFGEQFMSTTKQDVELLLKRLPDNTSVEDIHYHLYVLDKVRRGLEDARTNGTLTQEEVEARFAEARQTAEAVKKAKESPLSGKPLREFDLE